MAGAQLWQLEEFQPPVVLDFVRGIKPPPQYQGSLFLPDNQIDDVEFEYFKGADETPVMAHVVGWDSEAPIAGRPPLGQKVSGELPPIKRKQRMSEKEIVRRYNTPRRGTADQQAALTRVYDDMARLVGSIQARMEWLTMQALSEDTVQYNEGGVIIEFDFGIPDVQQITLADTAGAATDGTGATRAEFGPSWLDTTNATPITDLQYLADSVEQERGERPTSFVCSRKTANALLSNAQIKGWTYAANAPDRPMTSEERDQTLQRYQLPTPVVYDVQVGNENADGSTTKVRTMRENAIVLLPAQPVGRRLWGPTAEAQALYGTPYAQQAPGIWGATYYLDEPPSQWTKAVAVAFPTMPDADKLAQMTVFPAT